MADNTKNLGQVAGVSISTIAPTNTALIWFDTTPNQLCHKIYDFSLGQWVVINNSILGQTTYSELQNQATSTGLSLGKFYIITDRGNIVATTISSTKIQYTDTQGNIVIDDLGSLQQYHVPSSNLRIDGLEGNFDEDTKTLTFNFDELEGTQEDYFFGKKVLANGLFSLFKMKLKNLISTASNNAITWVENGLFFNFSQALLNTANKIGGVVTYENFLTDQRRQDTSISVLNDTVTELPNTITQTVNNAVTDASINSKRIISLSPYNSQSPLAVNDTFTTAWNKIQGWFNTLRYATGSVLSGFVVPSTGSAPSNGDTVQTAIGKLYRTILNVSGGGVVINPESIGTTELANGAVTELKIASGAVSTRTIASNAVDNSKIANGAVNKSKLSFTLYRPFEASISLVRGGGGIVAYLDAVTESGVISSVSYTKLSDTSGYVTINQSNSLIWQSYGAVINVYMLGVSDSSSRFKTLNYTMFTGTGSSNAGCRILIDYTGIFTDSEIDGDIMINYLCLLNN
jgi:hypothetical protein